jgi:hypothetical protein
MFRGAWNCGEGSLRPLLYFSNSSKCPPVSHLGAKILHKIVIGYNNECTTVSERISLIPLLASPMSNATLFELHFNFIWNCHIFISREMLYQKKPF